MKFLYEFNENQVQNLSVFLDRVQLNGINEATAMVEIVNILNNPIQDANGNDKKVKEAIQKSNK